MSQTQLMKPEFISSCVSLVVVKLPKLKMKTTPMLFESQTQAKASILEGNTSVGSHNYLNIGVQITEMVQISEIILSMDANLLSYGLINCRLAIHKKLQT